MVSFRAGVDKVKTSIEHPTSNTQPRPRFASSLRSMFGVFASFLLIISSRAADTNAVLNGWFASQTNLQTWSADFTQTRALKTLTQPLVATGHISFAVPNKFRWELGRPAKTIALRQADEMFVIYPMLKRAERYPMGDKAPGEWR
ncbi:MAG: outer membrane lipoprotein carrier protein LolA, partial [Verrucomicrobia bacterium]